MRGDGDGDGDDQRFEQRRRGLSEARKERARTNRSRRQNSAEWPVAHAADQVHLPVDSEWGALLSEAGNTHGRENQRTDALVARRVRAYLDHIREQTQYI